MYLAHFDFDFNFFFFLVENFVPNEFQTSNIFFRNLYELSDISLLDLTMEEIDYVETLQHRVISRVDVCFIFFQFRIYFFRTKFCT